MHVNVAKEENHFRPKYLWHEVLGNQSIDFNEPVQGNFNPMVLSVDANTMWKLPAKSQQGFF